MIAPTQGQRVLRMAAMVGVIAIGAVAIIDHVQIARLVHGTQAYAARTDIRTLAQKVDTLDGALVRLQHQPAAVSQATFASARETLDARLGKVEQLAEAAASSDAVNTLDTRVRQLETRMASIPRDASAHAPHVRTPAKPVPLIPPFVLLGEDERGGETFLTVAPPHLHALGDVHLLQPGDNEGDWQLEALDKDTATFRVNGQTQRLPVR